MYFANFKTTTIENFKTDAFVEKWAMKFSAPNSVLKHGKNLNDFFTFIEKENIKEIFFHDLNFFGSFLDQWLMKNNYKFINFLDEDITLQPKEWKYICNGDGDMYIIIVKLKNGKTVKFVDSWKTINSSYKELKEAFDLDDEVINYNYSSKDDEKQKTEKEILTRMEKEIDIVKAAIIKCYAIYNKFLTKSSMALNDFKKFYNTENKNKRQYAIDFGGSVYNYSLKKMVPHNVLTEDEWNYVRKTHRGGYNWWKEGIKNKELNIPNGIIFDANSSHASVCYANKVPYGRMLSVKPLTKDYAKIITVVIKKAKKKKKEYPNLFRKEEKRYKIVEYVSEIRNEERTFWEEEFEFIKKYYKIDYFVLKERWFRTKPAFHNWLERKKDLKINAKDKVERELHKGVQNGVVGKMGQAIRIGARVIVKDGKHLHVAKKDMSFKNYHNKIVFVKKGERVLIDPTTGALLFKINNVVRRYGKDGEYGHKVMYKSAKQRNHIGTSSWIYMKAKLNLLKIIFDNLDIWLYSDSDSAVFSEKPKNIPVHENKFGYWKHEYKLDKFKMLRGKAYLMNVTHKWYKGKWKDNKEVVKKVSGLNQEGRDFINFNNFEIGLIVPNGKNMIMNTRSGKIKYKTDFELGKGMGE